MQKYLEKLISFKSISERKEESEKAIKWIESQIPSHYKTEIKKYNGFPVLKVGSERPTISLQAHLDVVSGEKSLFRTKVKEGRIYGRGVYDMKFAIAAYIQLLKEKNYGEKVGMLITSDEELGGFYGVKAVLEEGYSPKVCFLPDGGDNWKFELKTKGGYHLKISSEGVSGHASRPWSGESAIHNLVHFLTELEEIFEKSVDENDFKSTFNIGKIKGGQSTNKIASYAEAMVDIRFTDEKERKRIISKIEKLKDKYKKIKVKEEIYVDLFNTRVGNFHKLFSESAKRKGIKISETFAHGSSDARYFNKKNIPTIVIKPKGGGAHSSNEWVDLEDLKKYYSVLKDFIETL